MWIVVLLVGFRISCHIKGGLLPVVEALCRDASLGCPGGRSNTRRYLKIDSGFWFGCPPVLHQDVLWLGSWVVEPLWN